MKNNVVKIALIGLAAGLCMSAKSAPVQKTQEVAMTKCSKDSNEKKDCDGDQACNSQSSFFNSTRNGYREDIPAPKKTNLSEKRKSAAQKLKEGQ